MAGTPKYILILVIAAATFLMGLFVIKQRRTLTNVAAFFLCATAALQSVFLLGREWNLDHGRVPLPWNNLADGTGVLFSLAAVFFALAFPRPIPLTKKIMIPLAIFSAVIAGIAFLGGNFSEHAVVEHVHVFRTTGFYKLYVVYVLTTMAATIGILLWKYRRGQFDETNGRERKALGNVLVAFVTAITVGVAFAFVEPILLHDVRYFYLQTIGFMIATSTVFYSIVRFNAFDIETVVHKTLSWLVLSAGPLVAALWLGTRIKPHLAEAPAWQSSLAIGGIGFVCGLYLYLAQPYIDQLFDRRTHDLRKALEKMIADLAVIREVRAMAEGILDHLCRVLSVDVACALVISDSGDRMTTIASRGVKPGDSVDLPPEVSDHLRDGAIVQSDGKRESEGSSEKSDPAWRWLKVSNLAVCVPLVQRGGLIGAVALGRKRNLKRFTTRELAFLTRAAAAASIAFSNSLLFERVRGLDRLKTEFLSEVAHELRGPLSGISNVAAGLLEGDAGSLSDDQKRLLDIIRATGSEMKDLVGHLLDLSKIEMGVMTYEFGPMDIASVIRLAVELARGALTAKGLDLEVDVEDGLPMIRGDKARIRQCVSNLLSNAVKYTDQGEIRLSCRSHEGSIRVSIQDTGPGLKPEEIQTIFERYQRGRAVGAIEGSGLGLTLTKEIVRAHGGEIFVESVPGHGSTFFFDLPVASSVPAPAEGARSGEESNSRSMDQLFTASSPLPDDHPIHGALIEVSGAGETIVAIDDNPAEREALRTFLAREGYHPLTAKDGIEGLDLARSKSPHLVVTDLIMPRLSGAELCRMLKNDPATASIPVILVTARDSLGDMILGLQMGADDFVAKPYDFRALSARVAALLRMRRIREELEEAQGRLMEMELIATSTGTLIHAIKNPLVVIQNYVKWMKASVDRADLQGTGKGLAHIEASATAISRIIDGLRRAHLDPPRRSPVHLPELLESVLRELTVTSMLESIQIEREYAEVLGTVDGDRIQLGLAFTNLLSNAIEAMPEGGILILRVVAADPGGIQMEIEDSGEGIREDLRKELFKPFVTTKAQGTGLGLWTAKRIIESNHAGRLTIESIAGKGAVVRVWIPMGRSVNEVQEEGVCHGKGQYLGHRG